MDYSLINQWQLVSIPLTGITTFGTDFNSVHFVINSAPTSFQLDYVYLLETATIPPVISSGWSLNLNTGTNPTTNGIGTSDSVGVAIKTNSQTRLIVPANGIVELSNDELDQQLLTIRNDTIYKTNIPTAYGTLPIVVEVRNDSTFITCPTCDTTGGGGSQNLFQVTHVGNSTDTSIVINGDTPDNGGILYFDNAANGSTYLNSSTIGSGTLNSYLGWTAGDASVGDINTFVGAEAGGSNNGSRNTFVGEGAGFLNDGTLNTFLGENTGYNNAGDSNVFLGNRMGYNNTGSSNILIGVINVAPTSPNTHRNVIVLGNGENLASADSQFVIAPYVGKMFLDLDSASGTAPAIAGIDENGNWRKYATPSGGTAPFLPVVGTGTATGDIIGDLDGYQLDINNASDWNIRSKGGMGIYAEDAAGSFGMTRSGGFGSPEVQMTNTMLGSGEASDITFSGSLNLSSSNASGSDSRITINPANIVVKPPLGLFYIDTLASGAGTKALKYNPSTGAVTSSDTLAVSGVYALINANTTGSAATLTTPRLINGVSFNGSADISTDTYLKAIQAMGSTIVAQNIDGTLADASGAISVASQRVYFLAVYLPVATTITGFKWKQSVTGNYTASNYNGGGLYTYSGGTLTLVASSTNDANIWTATVNTIGSKAFSSTYSAAAGLYFVAVTYSASSAVTPPSLGSLVPSSSVNIVNDFTNSAKSSGFISSLTALPSPTQAMSGITATGGEIWVALF